MEEEDPPIGGYGMGGRGHLDVGGFNLAVVQTVLLFVLEMWVISPCIGRILGRFIHQVIYQLALRHLIRKLGGSWS